MVTLTAGGHVTLNIATRLFFSGTHVFYTFLVGYSCGSGGKVESPSLFVGATECLMRRSMHAQRLVIMAPLNAILRFTCT